MVGRQERDERVEQSTLEKIDKYAGDSEFIRDILTEFFYDMSDHTPMTKNIYVIRVMNYFDYMRDICGKEIDSTEVFDMIKKADINRYVDYIKHYTDGDGNRRDRSESTRVTMISAVVGFYKFLEDNSYIRRNPCDGIRTPRVKTENEVVEMTEDEINQLRANILKDPENESKVENHRRWMNRDMAIVTIGCRTGLRLSALCDINIEDIDLSQHSLRVVEKGNKTRIIMFGENTAEVIGRWLADRTKLMDGYSSCDALFVSNQRKRISRRTVQMMISKYTSDMDKHITPHKMRSTCATNLYKQTGDIYLVQSVLGHENIQNTRRYTKISESQKIMAANVLDKI